MLSESYGHFWIAASTVASASWTCWCKRSAVAVAQVSWSRKEFKGGDLDLPKPLQPQPEALASLALTSPVVPVSALPVERSSSEARRSSWRRAKSRGNVSEAEARLNIWQRGEKPGKKRHLSSTSFLLHSQCLKIRTITFV